MHPAPRTDVRMKNTFDLQPVQRECRVLGASTWCTIMARILAGSAAILSSAADAGAADRALAQVDRDRLERRMSQPLDLIRRREITRNSRREQIGRVPRFTHDDAQQLERLPRNIVANGPQPTHHNSYSRSQHHAPAPRGRSHAPATRRTGRWKCPPNQCGTRHTSAAHRAGYRRHDSAGVGIRSRLPSGAQTNVPGHQAAPPSSSTAWRQGWVSSGRRPCCR